MSEQPTTGSCAAQPGRAAATGLSSAWRRFRAHKAAMIAVVYLLTLAVATTTAGLWAAPLFGDPYYIDSTTLTSRSLQPPSLSHPLGTDDLGRDLLSRLVYGARISLALGIASTIIATGLGLLIGGVAGYYGGATDAVAMRTTDVFLAFPFILLAIVVVSVLGGGPASVLVAMVVLGWMAIARVFRSSVLAVKGAAYVDAARAMGAGDARILARHILPNAIAPVIVYSMMSVGGVILAESALSFLGLGAQPPVPSWGRMLSEAQYFWNTHPWLFVFPGLAIVGTVLAFVVIGDGLRDALDVNVRG